MNFNSHKTRRYLPTIAVLGAIVAIVATTAMNTTTVQSASDTASGKVILQPERVDLPTLREGDKVDVPFRIVNQTNKTARYKVETTCSCSAPPKNVLEVPAGQSLEFAIAIDTRRTPGMNLAMIELFTEAGDLIDTSLLSFDSAPGILVEPSCLAVGRGKREAKANIFAVSPTPPDDVVVRCDAPGVKVSVEKLSRRRWRLAATLLQGQTGLNKITVHDTKGNLLGTVPLSSSSTASGELRIASTFQVLPNDNLRAWTLLESAAKVTKVVSGEVQLATVIERVDDDTTWIGIDFPRELAGRTATVVATGSAGTAKISLRLPSHGSADGAE